MDVQEQQTMVRVDRGPRGEWVIELSGNAGPATRITCNSLEDARRDARRIAQRSGPCALVVCNAYHHVIDSSLVAADGDRGARG